MLPPCNTCKQTCIPINGLCGECYDKLCRRAATLITMERKLLEHLLSNSIVLLYEWNLKPSTDTHITIVKELENDIKQTKELLGE